MKAPKSIVSVTLNPAIDHTVFVHDLKPGSVNRAQCSCRQAGGKGVNVATLMSLGGTPSIVSGFLGKSNNVIFSNHFKDYGLKNAFVEVEGETREGVKVVDSSNDITTDINLPGITPNVLQCDQLTETLLQLVENDRWFVFAGSLPAGIDPVFLGSLISSIREMGANVAIDSSGPALKRAIEAGVDLAKPNIHELEELVGGELKGLPSVIAAAREVRLNIGSDLIVSLGEDGALFLSKSEEFFTHAPSVKVVSTVGAGDALLAGYLHARIRGMSLRECARYATVFAWSRLESLNPSLPEAQLFQQRINEVEIVSLFGESL